MSPTASLAHVRNSRPFFWLMMATLVATSFPGLVHAQAPAAEVTLLERAFVFDEGKDVSRDRAAAAALYRQAADAGDAFAHLRLGYLTETGDGVPQDYAAARAHYQIAVDAGLPAARLRLAICHLEGWGGPVDRPAFVRELRAAAEAGHIESAKILGQIYLIGFAVPADREESLKWLQRAATKEDAFAQYAIGRVMEQKRRLALMPDSQLARSWFQLSAEQEYRTGMRAMARTLLTGSQTERNWALGRRWLELATENGDDEAPYVLALCELLHVESPTRDADRARAWLKLASDRHNPNATEVLQLELAGRSLTEALRYVLSTPFEDRYVQNSIVKAGTDATRPPAVYRVVKPIYPQSLRLGNVTGEVMVEFFVDTTGQVRDARAVKSSHPLFSERAIESVQQWRFHAARRDGRLVTTRMRVPVMFTLNEERVEGVDGFLNAAMALARKLGPEVEADAKDLRPAVRKTSGPRPTMPDGSPLPADAGVLLLLVLDSSGRPIRGHILQADPVEVGPVLLASVLTHTFAPRELNGEAVSSNVVVSYATGRFRGNQVFKSTPVNAPK